MKLPKTAPSWRRQLRAHISSRARGEQLLEQVILSPNPKKTQPLASKKYHIATIFISQILSLFAAGQLEGAYSLSAQTIIRGKQGISHCDIFPAFGMAIQAVTRTAESSPLIRPIGIPVFPILGQLLGVKAVGEHGPNLARARARGFKCQVAAVRRPRGMLVAAGIVRQLDNPSGGNFHNVNVIGSGF